MKKNNYLNIYNQAHNNATDLLCEVKILFENKKYARSYFLAFTALEEISKSQFAADVFTGFSQEADFLKFYKDHHKKIDGVEWAHFDANSDLYNIIYIGPDIDDTKKITSKKPLWEKRQNSLYVNINEQEIIVPAEQISKDDAEGIIHITETALSRIMEVTEVFGNQIGTKGFMK